MFGKLFGSNKKKPALDKQAPALTPAVRQAILNVVGAKSIPPMPGSAQKAFALATNPKADARDFIEVIEKDEALSARILRIANSVYFDRGKRSETIDEAVVVIGLDELRCLLNANTLCDIFPSKHAARTQLWANDIACALIARILTQRSQPSLKDGAFLAGLMHDVGKLLLLQRNSDEYSKILQVVESERADFCEAESRSFPFDHTEVGLLIGEQWNFSEDLNLVIRRHHQPWEELPAGHLVTFVKAADHIAHALGLGHNVKMNGFKNRKAESLDEVLERVNISPDERKSFLDLCKRTFDVEYELYAGASGR